MATPLEHSIDNNHVRNSGDNLNKDSVTSSRMTLKEICNSENCAMNKILTELCRQSPGVMSESN